MVRLLFLGNAISSSPLSLMQWHTHTLNPFNHDIHLIDE